MRRVALACLCTFAAAHAPAASAATTPVTLRLLRIGGSLEIPDDGLWWELRKRDPRYDAVAPLAELHVLLPGTSIAKLYVAETTATLDCEGALRALAATKGGTVIGGLPKLPSGYHPAATSIDHGDAGHLLTLCYARATRRLRVQSVEHWPTRDLERFVPILTAIAKASDDAPATAPTTPPAQARAQPTQQPPGAT